MIEEMSERSRVVLPPAAGASFEVYVNGVRQQEGTDFTREGGVLVFPRTLKQEGRLGPWRWLSLMLGVAGTYRQNDSVDVIFTAGGQRHVASRLPITTDEPSG
jgi:hypothetical protein